MNNDLEQFSEERLIELSRFKQASELAALARIALSVKQAKPTFEDWISSRTDTIEVDCGCVTTEAFYHWLKVAYEATPQPAHTEQAIKITQVMLDAAVADYCTTGKYTVENIPYELRRQVEFEAESTFKAMLAAAPKPESE